MIKGAREILGSVPGRHLDPLLLAKSQSGGSVGFVMIAYRPESSGGAYFDLLFFRGAVIYDCARLNQDLRFKLHIDTALQTFGRHREEEGTSIFLYQAPEAEIRRFCSTFYYEPCLKVQTEALSPHQIASLLTLSRCRRGIIECNDFTRGTPAIELAEIHSAGQLAGFRPGLRNGRILLYDIEKNRELVGERYPDASLQVAAPGGGSGAPIRPSGERTRAPRRNRPSGGRSRPEKNAPLGETQLSLSLPAGEPAVPSPEGPAPESEFSAMFDRLLRSFRQQMSEAFGDGCDGVLHKAEQEVKILSPSFDCDRICDSTALAVMDLMAAVVREASIFRRSKLRRGALALIADLYNKEYEVLERHRALERVEQLYYRLRT